MMKLVRRISDVPKGEHWVILENTSYFIPGDERSRTSPGHGYPESTEHAMNYYVFDNEDEFKKELIRLTESNLKYYSPNKIMGIHVGKTYQLTQTVMVS